MPTLPAFRAPTHMIARTACLAVLPLLILAGNAAAQAVAPPDTTRWGWEVQADLAKNPLEPPDTSSPGPPRRASSTT